jgi:hypothetical protein
MTGWGAAEDPSYTDQHAVLVVGSTPASRQAAEDAVGGAGRRLIASVDLADAAAALSQSVTLDTILIETAGANPDLLESALAVIDVIARERRLSVIATLDTDTIDLVASQLDGNRVQLLCDATAAERIAALHWAGALAGDMLHDRGYETDARLHRLNAEVARFAETLAQIAADRAQPGLGGVREAVRGYHGEPSGDPSPPPEPGQVREVIRARRMRATHFPPDLFADPAWDMLLDLFAAELEHRRVSVSSLCIAAAVPGTTALRWIGSMTAAKLFTRYADPQDRRRAFLSLSDTARAGMMGYFGAVRRAGLSPA